MGLAASQGRLLSITARMSDVEFSSQQLQQQKIRLSMSSEEISRQYTDALNQKKMVGATFNNGTAANVDLTYNLLTASNSPLAGDYCLTDANNKVFVTTTEANAFKASQAQGGGMQEFCLINSSQSSNTYYENLFTRMAQGYTTIDPANQNSANWLDTQLKNGGAFLEKFDATSQKFVDTDTTSSSEISEQADNSNTAAIEAKYDADMQAIQTKDKRLDLNIKQLDTEHQALQTEMDSVKKVIDKNIESSFKTFG